MSWRRELRLLVVDPSIGRTGALQCARQMAEALQGQASCTLVLPEGATPPEADLAPFQACQQLNLRNPGRSPLSLLRWLWALLTSSVRLRWMLHRLRSTHLVLNDWYLLQGILCRLLGYRGVILTWVRLDPWRFGRRPAAVLFRLIAATSSQLVVVSHHVQQRLPRGVTSTLLYDALPRPALPRLPPDGQRLVFVGNYTPGKGQDVALEAFARIARCHPQASLEFHGGTLSRPGNARWLASLQQRARQLGLAERIHFNSFAPDPRPLLQTALVALNLSEAESFSLTVLEASGAGVAVIATACGGPAEIVVPGETGLLVPVGDVEATAVALDQLLQDPDWALAMGAAAAQRVQHHFAAERYREQLFKLIGRYNQ